MYWTKHIPWSSILMVGSLALLAAFEFFWVKGEYHDEQDRLQEEQTYRFHSAIRELEDSLFHFSVWTPFQADVDSVEFQLRYPARSNWRGIAWK